MTDVTTTLFMPKLSERIFNKLGKFIQNEYGIKMPPAKKIMLQSRLQKRLKVLGYQSFEEYYDYIFSPEGHLEIVQMIDVVSTNKTDFFREPAHFDHLVEHVLPKLRDPFSETPTKLLNVWSAGCSTGEEPYTIAMVLNEYAAQMQNFSYHITATDISTRVLSYARDAIYAESKIDPVPMSLRKKYLLRSKDPQKSLIRIHPLLREKIYFKRLNFMDDSFNLKKKFDIIFCRNVVIYFDMETQKKLFTKFARYLNPKGYLFIGHSETLNGLDLPFEPVAPTIYQKTF